MNNSNDTWYMNLALEQALKAQALEEVPIGAVIVDPQGKVISEGHNLKESKNNPCGHAEIIVLEKAGAALENWRLLGCTVYVTLEPCPMCMMALVHSRVSRVVFGAYDIKGGSLSLGFNFDHNPKLNHEFKICGGVNHFECSKILSDFFRLKRSYYKKLK
ncbi:MAG: tRNA adenosine(34) deaminase TadA [Bacteriovoracaceae bacterium]